MRPQLMLLLLLLCLGLRLAFASYARRCSIRKLLVYWHRRNENTTTQGLDAERWRSSKQHQPHNQQQCYGVKVTLHSSSLLLGVLIERRQRPLLPTANEKILHFFFKGLVTRWTRSGQPEPGIIRTLEYISSCSCFVRLLIDTYLVHRL